MLSRNEMKRRQERVLALLKREGCWMSMARIAYGSDLTYDTVRPVLGALARAGLVERLSNEHTAPWGLAGLSKNQRSERLKDLEWKRSERERARFERACRKANVEVDEHLAWLDRVAQQKAWREQMAELNKR